MYLVTAPGAPTYFRAKACNRDSLEWTTSGDDGASGTAYRYEIRKSSSPITLSNFAAAELLATVSPLVSGSVQRTASGLAGSPGTGKYFAVLAQDDVGTLASGLATTYVGPDQSAPGRTTGLTATQLLSGGPAGQARLRWTSAGSDSNSGTPDHYELRVNPSPITSANWNNAVVIGSPSGVAAGTLVTVYYPMQTCNETYYFALKTVDEFCRESLVSNSPSAVGACFVQLVSGREGDRGSNLPQVLDVKLARLSSSGIELRIEVPSSIESRVASVTIHDLLGRNVATLVKSSLPPGVHQIVWDLRTSAGTRVPMGMYAARVASGGDFKTIKFAVVR